MRLKAICDLAQLSPADLIAEVSTGIEHSISNAVRLEKDAEIIHQRNTNSYDVLLAVAREEAAKALILFDIVRCPRESTHFQRHLRRFNNHLAKGVYAEMCDWEPATFADLRSYIARELEEFYLDGPNDYDWIFWNRIRSSRDSSMYVDYVESDGEHRWTEPHAIAQLVPHSTPRVTSITAGLKETGCTSPDALAIIRDIWQRIPMHDAYSRLELRAATYRTLEAIELKGLLNDSNRNALATVVNYLPFPIYDLDLEMRKVAEAALAAIRDGHRS